MTMKIPADEPWLTAFARPDDVNLEDVRARARKATRAALFRRGRDPEADDVIDRASGERVVATGTSAGIETRPTDRRLRTGGRNR